MVASSLKLGARVRRTAIASIHMWSRIATIGHRSGINCFRNELVWFFKRRNRSKRLRTNPAQRKTFQTFEGDRNSWVAENTWRSEVFQICCSFCCFLNYYSKMTMTNRRRRDRHSNLVTDSESWARGGRGWPRRMPTEPDSRGWQRKIGLASRGRAPRRIERWVFRVIRKLSFAWTRVGAWLRLDKPNAPVCLLLLSNSYYFITWPT